MDNTDPEGRKDTPVTGVKRLTPATTSIYKATFSLIHCSVKDDGLYRGVFAVRMFPVGHPDRYISIHYTDEKDKEREVGVIEDLNDFPPEQQDLIRRSLAGQYYEQIIHRVLDIRCEYGLLFFDVDTNRGRDEFVMPWRNDRAQDYGEKGKILLDALDNRYIVPDVEALPAADHSRFMRYIYW